MTFWRIGLAATFAATLFSGLWAQKGGYSFKIAKLKYGGGGDWYANPSSLPNLFRYIRENTKMNIYLEEEVVEPGSALIFQYPMLYITGHGNIEFTPSEVENLRKYLYAGGFLLMDDNYGLHEYAKREIKKLFPDVPLVEIPFSHPIYHQHYDFPNGIPKIHEHDGKPAQAFGIFLDGRLALMLTYETDLGDGWEDAAIHNNPEEVREKAFRMGTNIIMYLLTR
ncbi:MAG: DUF4159 domain-containing protein [Bacteroidia bacterium]|nr:DUF4159 domain-containing protein [Bacteroidia bacterium]